MSFLYNSDGISDDLDVATKIGLVWRIATETLSDSDPSSMRVLAFKKLRYVGHPNAAARSG